MFPSVFLYRWHDWKPSTHSKVKPGVEMTSNIVWWSERVLKTMNLQWKQPGILAALVAALLFGAGTPLAKWLLGTTNPWMLAALLYLGSGLGLTLYRRLRNMPRVKLEKGQGKWLAAAVICGGGIAPVLLMTGLANMPASHAALLLNLEAVLTALLAWAVFRENVDIRIALGMAAIVGGALLLSVAPSDLSADGLALWPSLAVALACFFWALDNNFTRKVALADASWIASVKGLAAGGVNLCLAWMLGASWPALSTLPAALAVGFFAYGVSLTLFVVGLRHLGASRAGAYFSTAPFAGAIGSVWLFGEPVTGYLLAAAALMAIGLWLHLSERHAHAHTHEPLAHSHLHTHGANGADGDMHHAHTHEPPFEGKHAHRHFHEPVRHTHAHYPDAHHQHEH
jgi:drug/metabolite transporter (DMT)-like permease